MLLGKPENDNPFMAPCDNPDVCFVVVDVYVQKDYSPSINEEVLQRLEVRILLTYFLSIVVIPQDMSRMTANLQGPR